jgi:ferredoxin-NADP reductase
MTQLDHPKLENARLRCVAVRPETSAAKTYVFELEDDEEFGFKAGQFLTFVFDIDGIEELRSYSLSSSQLQSKRLSITVKKVEGGRVSNWLFDNMTVGVQVLASGTHGQFHCDGTDDAPLLLLTAGSGITPAASMMRSFSDLGSTRDVVFLHYASSPSDMIFADELRHWARTIPNARIIPLVTRPDAYSGWVGPVGRPSVPQLQGLVPDIARRKVYCCGPETFMDAIGSMLPDLHVSPENFLTESFGESAVPAMQDLPAPASSQLSATFTRSGKTVAVSTEQTLLSAAQAAGIRVQTSCKKGACGTCRVKIEGGTVDIRHDGGISQREIDNGFALACCSYATSNVVIKA